MSSVSNNFRCTSELPYFVGEMLYRKETELTNIRSFVYIVRTVGSVALDVLAKDLEPHVSASVILDIDLDYFSTTNPFISLYTKKQMECMEKLYKLDVLTSTEETVRRRSQQLQWLKDTLKISFDKANRNTLGEKTLDEDPR